MTQDFLAADEIPTNTRPGSYGSDPALAQPSGFSLNTLEPKVPLREQAHPEKCEFISPSRQPGVRLLPYHHVFDAKREGKHMKKDHTCHGRSSFRRVAPTS
jgi:hypothetical protein